VATAVSLSTNRLRGQGHVDSRQMRAQRQGSCLEVIARAIAGGGVRERSAAVAIMGAALPLVRVGQPARYAYQRHRPEETTLYRVVQEELATFLAQVGTDRWCTCSRCTPRGLPACPRSHPTSYWTKGQ
jgi:hypothetical protein